MLRLPQACLFCDGHFSGVTVSALPISLSWPGSGLLMLSPASSIKLCLVHGLSHLVSTLHGSCSDGAGQPRVTMADWISQVFGQFSLYYAVRTPVR
jgi:hypothetical protein